MRNVPQVPKRSVTSYDVARAVGVSQSAVSRAFTPGSPIAEAKRLLILDAARALGYQPNAIARSMSSARVGERQRSGLVGLVVTRLHDPFFANAIEMFSQQLQARGWHMVLFTVEDASEVDHALQELMRYKVDGVVVLSALLSGHMAETCRANRTPVVLYNRAASDPRIGSVRIDNIAGARLAAEVLVAAGHQRIALVCGPEGDPTSQEREAGLRQRLAEAGLSLFRREAGDYTFESGHEAAMRLFALGERPDAVFCASDVMALGVLHCARHEFALAVGETLSIIGFDDIPAACWPGHSLTTIRQPVAQMCREAVEILVTQMEGGTPLRPHLMMPGALILRGSARRPAD